ncbi:hypothetical protein N9N03_00200 [Chlamydiia bacterium]|nr:hypothetical protein [Chlamydiia bacterium]
MYTTNTAYLSESQTELFKTILQLDEVELIGQLENNTDLTSGITVSDLCVTRLVLEFQIDNPLFHEKKIETVIIFDSKGQKHILEANKKINKDQKKKLMRFLQNTRYHYKIQHLIKLRQNIKDPHLDSCILKTKPVTKLHLKLSENNINLSNNELLGLLDHIDVTHINGYLNNDSVSLDTNVIYIIIKSALIRGSDVSARILSQNYLNNLFNENNHFLLTVSKHLEDNSSELLTFTTFLTEQGISIED